MTTALRIYRWWHSEIIDRNPDAIEVLLGWIIPGIITAMFIGAGIGIGIGLWLGAGQLIPGLIAPFAWLFGWDALMALADRKAEELSR